jgi:peptidoglycan/LPS O-acetylase OafA/YrhL
VQAQPNPAQAAILSAVTTEPGTAETLAGTRAGTAAPAAPAAAAAKPRARAAGLDGLRALAVLAVLAFHLNLPWTPGGFLGVDVFFVLSGFLITDLLVARYTHGRKVGLRDFWIRRARRLVPALAVMLVAVTAFIALFEPAQLAGLRPALVGAVTYTSNWWQAFQHQSYFDLYGPPPALQHLWSLAVEEQFYLLWPLLLVVVLAVLRRPAHRALVAWLGAAGSALLMFAIYVPGQDPSLVYYGTDTHASALMIGAAIALTWPLASIAKISRTWPVDLLGLAGLAVLGWAVWHLSGSDPLVYPVGIVLAALAAGCVVVAAVAPGRIAAALSARPLRWIGVRSYGIYLWHWPVIAITAGLAVRSAGSAPARLIDIVVPIALAAASWRWLECPILRNGARAAFRDRVRRVRNAAGTGRLSPSVAVTVVAALAALAVTAVAGYGVVRRKSGPTLESQIAVGARLIRRPKNQGPGLHSSLGRQAPRAGAGPFLPSSAPAPPAASGAKVMAVGDSVMLASAPELQDALPGIAIDAVVSRQMSAGVSEIRQDAADGGLRPVVIIGLGTNGTVTPAEIGQIRHAIGHRWLILVNTFVPRSWEQEVNSAIARAARRYPNVLMVNWHAAIEDHTSLLWGDGIHPQPVGGVLYAKVVKAVVARALAHPPVLTRPAGPAPKSRAPARNPARRW